ncbi:hypothetical protein CDG79_33090 [Nostoc sp. 'Peltigera membranacea cyanobiont' 232]|nr:hypothetical protein CDG79_33090 [Nostoc sp. 'Peltigera membranacea cyanobiont' 232]
MAIEVFPSSFYCDCGHKSYFFENTVSEMEKMSRTKLVTLNDSEENEHTIVFFNGLAIEIIYSKLGKCKITDSQ